MSHKLAFRCKNCGHLLHSGHGGDANFPHSCPVCKAGMVPAMSIGQLQKDRPELFKDLQSAEISQRTLKLPFNMVAFADHSNWQVLADMTAEELKAIDHALCPEHCERHVPCKIEVHSRPSTAQERFAVDGPGTQDKASV